MKPAVFWDRDGVVNVSPGAGYVLRAEDFHFSPGIEQALRLCRERGYGLVLVTSQQGVGKGLMSQADLDFIHERMQQHLAEHGAEFDDIRACTHLKGSCTCRKPSPEMILRSAEAFGWDLSASWIIGDHDRDIQMGKNAGVRGSIRILSHHEPTVQADHTLSSTEGLHDLLAEVLDFPFQDTGSG
jgi:D-glycero-D-manno-heptose 1,7-bisphosphate phosphatase